MKKACVLCGGRLAHGICTECGMDNRKSDEMYYQAMRENECAGEGLSHVHKVWGKAEKYQAPVMNQNRQQGQKQQRRNTRTQRPGGYSVRKKAAGRSADKKSVWIWILIALALLWEFFFG